MAILNNNAAYAIVAEAYKQAAGEKALATVDLNDFIDGGIAHADLGTYRDAFTKALILQGVKNVYMDGEYIRSKDAGFRIEDMDFNAILQAITFEIPEAQASHAWQDFTDPLNPATVGTYTVKFANTNSALYGKTASWELQYDYSTEQLEDAFKDMDSLMSYLGALKLAIRNAIEGQDEALDETLRNALIANLLVNDESVSGVRSIVDLRAGYNAEQGANVQTKEEFFATPDCTRYMARKIKEYMRYFRRQTKLFNLAGRKTFTPDSRMKLQILGYAADAFNANSQADTFNAEFTALPGYEEVPWWQDPVGASSKLSLEDLSSINVLPDGGTANKDEVVASGVVALLADRWAVIHAVKSRRVAQKYHEPEDLYQNFLQFRDLRAVMNTQNAVVFIVSDAQNAAPFTSLPPANVFITNTSDNPVPTEEITPSP